MKKKKKRESRILTKLNHDARCPEFTWRFMPRGLNNFSQKRHGIRAASSTASSNFEHAPAKPTSAKTSPKLSTFMLVFKVIPHMHRKWTLEECADEILPKFRSSQMTDVWIVWGKHIQPLELPIQTFSILRDYCYA